MTQTAGAHLASAESRRDFNEQSITDAVLDRIKDTPDPRLKQIMTSLIQHLHDFIRDIEPTFDEWSAAIAFLTRTGQMCDDKRQEFILLSDTLGASMLVDAINHRMPEGTTETTVLGPFYVENPPEQPQGTDISAGLEGAPMFADVTVTDPAGKPIAGAVVDVWQSDEDGFYDVQRKDLDEPTLRARFRTDENGRLTFWSTLPKFYPIPDDGPVGDMLKATKRHPYRPAHVHFMISAPGFERLITHVFVSGDPYLDSDAVFGVKDSLIADFPVQQGPTPDGRNIGREWHKLAYHFGLKPAA